MRAGIAFSHQTDIGNVGRSEVTSRVSVDVVEAFMVSTTANIVHIHNGCIANDNNLFGVKAYRAHVTTDSAGFSQQLCLCHFQLNCAYSVLYFGFVNLVVTANKAQYQAFFALVCNSFYGFFNRSVEESANVGNSLAVRSFNLAQLLHFFCRSLYRIQLCLFDIGSVIAFGAVSNFCFTAVCQHHELMAAGTADSTAVCFYRAEVQTAAGKDFVISIIHSLIGNVQTCFITVEGIAILHNEVTAAHQAEARTTFVTEFVLNLVQVQRQLTVGTYIVLNQGSNHFLVGRTKAVFMAVTVLQAYHFCAVSVPTAAFLPDFCRLHNRHHDFLAACMVHLFADNIFDFFNNTPSQRQIGVHAIGGFTHKTGTQQQLMARNFSLGRNLTQSGCIHFRNFH